MSGASFAIGAALALLLATPLSAAAAQDVDPAPPAAAPPSAAPASVEGPAEEPTAPMIEISPDDTLVDVAGSLLVMYREDPAEAPGLEGDVQRVVSVLVGDSYLELSGEQVADAATGDRFTGTVAIPEEVVATVPGGEAATDESLAVAASDAADPVAIEDGEIATAESATVPSHAVRYLGALPSIGARTNYYTPTGTPSATNLLNLVSGYWSGQTGGAISSSAIPTPIAYASASTTCPANPTAMWAEAVNRQFPSLYPNTTAGLQSFLAKTDGDHVVVILPNGCKDASSSGVGTVGGSLFRNGVLSIVGGTDIDKSTIIHEVGHNMSLGHSNLTVCPSKCTTTEYGDFYDVMGIGVYGFDTPAQLNIRSKWALGLVDETQVPLITLTSGTSQSYTLSLRGVSASGVIGYRVQDPTSGTVLFVENRQGEVGPFYTQSSSGMTFGSSKVPTRQGIRITAATAQSAGTGGTQVFAATCPDRSDYVCATASAVGQSVTNPSGSVKVTMLASGVAVDNNIRIDLTSSSPVYRFYSPQSSAHFYTISADERDSLIANYPPQVWTYEGVAYRAYTGSPAGTTSTYRFYSQSLGTHFYTTSAAERDAVITNYPTVWKYEGVAFNVIPLDSTDTATRTVYRFWSPVVRRHFYTASESEKNSLITNSSSYWSYEGPSFKVPGS